MANSYDLNITKGSEAYVRLSVKDSSNAPINLTGYGIRGSAKHKFSQTGILIDLRPSGVAGFLTSGFIDVRLLAAETKDLPVTQGVYDIEIFTGGYVEKIVQGMVNIFPESTTASS